ncbi:MAG TPA: universal stress protein, partial [Ktedonobacteraceae bacterium]|nr:universal stress protein [Ktedonobacteraceae bacterium]
MDDRPKAEEILERYGLRDSDQQGVASELKNTNGYFQRGRLRVYLGAAAGVGKTYAMLNEGHRRKERGTDVVAGYVEAHKRPQTLAQLRDLEIVPRKKIPYRGILLEEMDTDAIIARHPQVALVDELAHTNVAGSRHPKRYQDVEELLNAGIDVVTTLNVQHLESLNDLIASITGVQVRETLPDSILDKADEVELIDIAPYSLRQRMKHGNIYPPERIEAALNNFFREGNLTALREIALRRTAEKTEEQLEAYMTEHHISSSWATTERVMVAFDARPRSREVIRDAWRLAHSLHADLFAIYVQPTGYQDLIKRFLFLFSAHARSKGFRKQRLDCLTNLTRLAEDLGASIIQVSSNNIADALIAEARARHITQLVLGLPARTRWEELLSGSVINRILRLNSEMRIHLVPY